MSEKHTEKLNEAIRLYKLLALTIQKSAAAGWLDLDLPVTQMRALIHLSNAQETATVGSLSEELHIGLPAASRLVERLMKEELVIREEDPADRRRALVRLAPRGQAIIEGLGSVMRDKIQTLFRQLPEDDLDSLLRGLYALEALIGQLVVEE